MWMSLFWWKQCMLHSKNIVYTVMYIEIYGGKHNDYVFHIILMHYFLLEITEILDFVKMPAFHQNCKFPSNVWFSFDTKWELHTRKTLCIKWCIRKFTEENIVFTQCVQLHIPTFYQKLTKCGSCKTPKFRPKLKTSTKFRQNLVKITHPTPEKH